ncbi:MAG: hypothetical protein WBJ21_06155 [Burkholderiaceae bacterium]
MKLFSDRSIVEQRLVFVFILIWMLLSTMAYFDRLGFYPAVSDSPSLLMDVWSFINFPGVNAFSYRDGHIGECSYLGGGDGTFLGANTDCSKVERGSFVEFDFLGYCWFVVWPIIIFSGLYFGFLWVLSAETSKSNR